MKTATALLVAGLALAVCLPVRAEPANSLSRARSGVIDGTTPGILIFGERPTPAPQAADAATPTPTPKPAETVKATAPAGASVTAPPVARPTGVAPAAGVAALPKSEMTPAAAPPAAVPMPAAAPAPAAAQTPAAPSAFERLGALLGASRTLSGEPLNAAKGHESGSNGIPIPTAADRAPGAAKP